MDESDLEEGGVWRILGESRLRRAPERFVSGVMRKIRVKGQGWGGTVWLAKALPFCCAGAFAAVVFCSGLVVDGVKVGENYAEFGIYEIEDVVAKASELVWSFENEIHP